MKKNICVVGGGYWGKNHIRTLNSLGHLGGMVDSNLSLIENYKKDYPKIKIFNELDEALSNNFFDGFVVATPAETHFKIAKKIINNNFHLLVEKPLTLSIDDAKELVELSKIKNINLMVGHLMLFHPAIRKIKKMIDENIIGDLQYVYSNRLNLGKVRTQENVFWSLAPHDISIFDFLIESTPKKIISNGSTFLQKGIPDSTITQLKYKNGVEGHIFVSWLHPFKEQRLVVIGSNAMITFEDSLDNKPLKLYTKKFDFEKGIPEKIDGPITLIDYENKMPLSEELEYFCNHLDGNKIKLSNGEHALRVTNILVSASKQLINNE
tara:strand:- start:25932 stop:26900 length:969 start_codon:yes stop_codon:yes gene_type:complete